MTRIPQFGGGQVPNIGQQQQQMQTQVQKAISQLSQGIYLQTAINHIVTRDDHQAADPDKLHQLAKDSVTAAKCYFEGIGVLKPEEEKE